MEILAAIVVTLGAAAAGWVVVGSSRRLSALFGLAPPGLPRAIQEPERWRQFGARRGLERVPAPDGGPPWWFGGRIEGIWVGITCDWRPPDRTLCRIQLLFDAPLPGELRARRRAPGDEGGLRAGDPTLDLALYIEAADPEFARRLLVDEALRGALLSTLHGHPGATLDAKGIQLPIDVAPSVHDAVIEGVTALRPGPDRVDTAALDAALDEAVALIRALAARARSLGAAPSGGEAGPDPADEAGLG